MCLSTDPKKERRLTNTGQPHARALIAGFGNIFRRDDGVAWYVINALRARWQQPPLAQLDDGFNELGRPVDTVLLHQLVPELAEDLKDYARVIFVDAHVGETIPEPIHVEPLAVRHRTPFVYHQTHPSTVLALARRLHGHAPQAWLVSVLGHDFDFGDALSEATARLVEPAAERILALLAVPLETEGQPHA